MAFQSSSLSGGCTRATFVLTNENVYINPKVIEQVKSDITDAQCLDVIDMEVHADVDWAYRAAVTAQVWSASRVTVLSLWGPRAARDTDEGHHVLKPAAGPGTSPEVTS